LRDAVARAAPSFAAAAISIAISLACTACRSPGAAATAAIVVGSKNFTEQVILGEILAALIEQRGGLSVRRRLDLGGTFVCHHALQAGEIDLYAEYTGTALTAILHRRPVSDRDTAYALVKEAYEPMGLVWTEPLGFEDTFALIVTREAAERNHLRSISDLERVKGSFRPGFGWEFVERPDGYPGLAAAYGWSFASRPREMDLGLIYRALHQGLVDVVAGNSTDGVIAKLDLVALADDRHYFPPYDAAPVARAAVLEAHPQLRGILAKLAGSITEDRMRAMNLEVDGDLRDPRDVAREFVASLP
jgi:osmoprotectant transport system substrate-binding protein